MSEVYLSRAVKEFLRIPYQALNRPARLLKPLCYDDRFLFTRAEAIADLVFLPSATLLNALDAAVATFLLVRIPFCI